MNIKNDFESSDSEIKALVPVADKKAIKHNALGNRYEPSPCPFCGIKKEVFVNDAGEYRCGACYAEW
ncbi:hypothetical protein [Brunnivagina elsteri]|uniref:Uncharacterized protein n=1 Tax=Brunnivagina elsteri CCALA 953 TaxID=987040 RepID=A0A2A2TEA9_9CYAN|nr:hypothetical protein [Calothrix elsteri]PAX52053.1 hypothetical protein CK510_21340 [Calothrix elsteri CCALA 953]